MMMSATIDFGTVISTGSAIADVSPILKVAGERDLLLLNKFLKNSTLAKHVKHEWVDVSLKTYRTFLNANITNVATSIVLKNGTLNPVNIFPNETRLRIGNEVLLVTAKTAETTTTSTWTVTRGIAGTTGTAASANAQVFILGSKLTEGQDMTGDRKTLGVRKDNMVQIYGASLKNTFTAENAKTVGMENQLAKQIAYEMANIKKEMQTDFFYGQKYTDANYSERYMGGLLWYAQAEGKTVDAGAVAITEALIEEEFIKYYDNSGSRDHLMIITSPRQQRRLNALKGALVVGGGMTNEETSINKYLKTYEFGGGLGADVFFSGCIGDNDMFFVDTSKIDFGCYTNSQLKLYDNAMTGLAKKVFIAGEYTAEFRNVKETVSVLTNLAV